MIAPKYEGIASLGYSSRCQGLNPLRGFDPFDCVSGVQLIEKIITQAKYFFSKFALVQNPPMYRCFLRHKALLYLSIILLGLGSYSCMSFYQKMSRFQQYAEMGNFEDAEKTLASSKKTSEGRNRFLYFCNMGWTQHMLGNEENSNVLLNQADDYIENEKENWALDALTFLSNPTIKPYEPERIESIMVNYYKAMNYLQLNDKEAALVEARRMTQKLYEQNERYKGNENRYSDDAFAHILIGLIYDASGDYNNAFIAYRNADRIYDEIYQPQFSISTPQQLKEDILRTADLSGMRSEVDRFERKFGMTYRAVQHEAQMIFFWENGFGPVKDQWSINFTKVSSKGGFVTFANDELGLSFPIFIGDMSSQDKTAFAQLEFFRIAFPKYVERKTVFKEAQVSIDGQSYSLQLAQDISAIANKVLNDRMLLELATSISRLAAKKATEAIIRHQNQDIGAAVGIINALTETADTRNWQTLPNHIYYTRIPLKIGDNQLSFSAKGCGQEEKQSYNFKAFQGQTIFFNYRSLASSSSILSSNIP